MGGILLQTSVVVMRMQGAKDAPVCLIFKPIDLLFFPWWRNCKVTVLGTEVAPFPSFGVGVFISLPVFCKNLCRLADTP
jgi:hypothetical protein